MSKSYRHIQEYEREIFELKGKGLTNREIAEKYGFTLEQVKGLVKRHNAKQRKLDAGIALRRKGRPPKDYAVSKEDKIAELKYIIARKDAKIKTLEMENELMRDFLSQTEKE